jgi:hypothetical protein
VVSGLKYASTTSGPYQAVMQVYRPVITMLASFAFSGWYWMMYVSCLHCLLTEVKIKVKCYLFLNQFP